MLFFCCWEVGDMSAPVAQKRTFLSFCISILCIILEHKTLAEQPHPEPPE